jgi:tRNA(Arg) A34 adenosine deaminase TadA
MAGRCRCAERRAVLKAGAAAMLLASFPALAADDGRAAFMRRAFELRKLALDRGDQPYGAVVVRQGRIIGEGVSAVVTTPDPTAHAEIEAIRDAARRLKTRDLSGAEMFGTSRACPMCEAGAYWAGISRLWHGESIAGGDAPRLR